MNIEDAFLKNVVFECFLLTGLAGISPWLHLDLRIIRKFELPVSWYTSNILQNESDLSWLRSQLAWDLAEVPVELGQITDKLIKTVVSLVRVVVHLLALIQFIKEIFVHICHMESFPQICNTNGVISDVLKSQQWEVTFSLDGDKAFFNDAFMIVLLSD